MKWVDRLLGRRQLDEGAPDPVAAADARREREHREALERVENAVRHTARAVAEARRTAR